MKPTSARNHSLAGELPGGRRSGDGYTIFTINDKNMVGRSMKAARPWVTYRTRFLVKAKQLTTSLAFTDMLGRQHSGRKGDYLVESSDGMLRIAPRQIFEDIYVPISSEEQIRNESLERAGSHRQSELHRRGEASQPDGRPLSLPLPRKAPQPYRERQNGGSNLRSL